MAAATRAKALQKLATILRVAVADGAIKVNPCDGMRRLSYLSKLVRGTRCPSIVTAEQLIRVLDFTHDEEAALREVAVPDRGKARRYG